MMAILRLLGICKPNMRSIRADREQQLINTQIELDQLAVELENVRGAIAALTQRKARLNRDLNRMRGEENE